MTTRTAEDLTIEVEALRQQLRDLNLTLSRVRQECRNFGNLSTTKFNAGYIQGAADAATAIDMVTHVVQSR